MFQEPHTESWQELWLGRRPSPVRDSNRQCSVPEIAQLAEQAFVDEIFDEILLRVLARLGRSQAALTSPRCLPAALRVIRSNLCRPSLRVDAVAEPLHVSRRTLERAFRRALGASIAQVITRLRLELARHRLETTALSVKAISEEAGFCSASYFCSQFRQHVGCTPLAYRRHVRQGAVQATEFRELQRPGFESGKR